MNILGIHLLKYLNKNAILDIPTNKICHNKYPWSKFIAEDLPSNSKYYSTELHVHCPDESNISPIPVAGGTISTELLCPLIA